MSNWAAIINAPLTITPELKQYYVTKLHEGILGVKFQKVDKTERLMRCTLKKELITVNVTVDINPVGEIVITQKKIKSPNANVCAVFDVDKQAWRSFRWDSVLFIEE